MKNLNVAFLIIIVFLVSCVSKSDYNKLLAENESLKMELEECNNGAEKLIANVEKAYSEKDFQTARMNIELLYENHPESPKNEEFKELLKLIEIEEIEEQERQEAEEQERIRLENLNNTGMWEVAYYVDDFGEPTDEGYIRNTNWITGTFSNTATQNSRLNVRFLITNSSDISFKLYEYAGNNPVKAYSTERYRVLIQDNDGERYTFTATNYSDRIGFSAADSRTVHGIFMKSGTIKFSVTEIETPTTQYQFTIENADWYENAYLKLQES